MGPMPLIDTAITLAAIVGAIVLLVVAIRLMRGIRDDWIRQIHRPATYRRFSAARKRRACCPGALFGPVLRPVARDHLRRRRGTGLDPVPGDRAAPAVDL